MLVRTEASAQIVILVRINVSALDIAEEVVESIVTTFAGLINAGICHLCSLWDLVVDGTVRRLSGSLVLGVTVDLGVVVTTVLVEG